MMWFIAALWIACSILFCGFNFAYFQRKWSSIRKGTYYDDAFNSVVLSTILGPAALLSTILLRHYRKGFLLPFTKQSKLEAGLM